MKISEETISAIKRLGVIDCKKAMEITVLQTAIAINDYYNKNPKTKEIVLKKIREMEANNATD